MKLKLAFLALALSPALYAQNPTAAPVTSAAAKAPAATVAPVPAPVVAVSCVAPSAVLSSDYLTDSARLMAGFDTKATGAFAAISGSPAITADRKSVV